VRFVTLVVLNMILSRHGGDDSSDGGSRRRGRGRRRRWRFRTSAARNHV